MKLFLGVKTMQALSFKGQCRGKKTLLVPKSCTKTSDYKANLQCFWLNLNFESMAPQVLMLEGKHLRHCAVCHQIIYHYKCNLWH